MKTGRNRAGRKPSFHLAGLDEATPVDQPEYKPRLKCGHCGHVFTPVFQRSRPDGRRECYCKSCGRVFRKHEAQYEALARQSRQGRGPANIL